MSDRARILNKLADHVTELLDEVRVNEPYVRDPIGRWRRKTHRARMHRHRRTDPGLLTQLKAATVPSSSADDDTAPSKPGSRPPASPALEVLDTITTGAAQLRAELRVELGRPPGRWQTVAGNLREIVGLCGEADPKTALAAAAEVTRWHRSARIALTYDVPVIELGVICPYCATPLLVRSDASSAVWCPDCTDDDGHHLTWPRSTWVYLLEQMGDDEAAVP